MSDLSNYELTRKSSHNCICLHLLNEKVVEVIGGIPHIITDNSTSLTLSPLGSVVLYFYEGCSQGFEFDRVFDVLRHITLVPNDSSFGDISESSYKFID